MMKKILVVIFAVVLAGTVAFAKAKKLHEDHGKGAKDEKKHQQMMPECPMMGGLNADMLKHLLKLSDEQADKINALHIEHKKTTLKYREELAPKEIRLERLLLEDAVNQAEVKALVMDIYRIKGEMKMVKVIHMLAIEKILTPEQRIKFKVMHKHRPPMMRGEGMKMKR